MRIPIQAVTAGIASVLWGYSAAPAIAGAAPQSNVTSPPIFQHSDSFISELLGTTIRNGTVISMDPTHMVIVCRNKGKTAQLDFVLNGVTVRRGEIAVGSQVTVHYRTQNSRNVATSIQLRQSLTRLESKSNTH